MRRLLFLLLAKTASGVSPLDFGKSLRQYSPIEQKKFEISEGMAFPSIAFFEKDGKQLAFLAARHANNADHITCQKLKEVFQEFAPGCLVLEGFSKSGTENYRKMIQENGIDPRDCGEPEYAASLAVKENIPFIGGEPDDSEIEGELQKQGYEPQDIWYIKFVGQIHQWKRHGKNYDSIEKYLKEYSPESEIEWFNSWYEYKVGKNPDLEFLKSSQQCAPLIDGDYIQRFTQAKSDIRNLRIFQTIQESCEKYGKVLVVYGASHYFQLYDVLVAEFGKPIYQRQNLLERFGSHIKDIKEFFWHS